MTSGRSRTDLALALLVLTLLSLGAWWHNSDGLTFGNRMLGWEYGFIAEALAEGRGFSDPFATGTGPTAWMPPLLVVLQAGVFTVFGAKTSAAVWVLLAIKYMALSYSLYLLLRLLPEHWAGRHRVGISLIFVVLLGIHPETFRYFHDVWLGLLSTVLILAAFASLQRNGRRATVWMITLGLLLPLISPPLTLAFLVLWLFHLQHRKLFVLSLCCFAATTGVWTLRNTLSVGLVVPIKSNLAFDFYQANALTPDGRLRLSTFYLHHPIHQNESRRRYAEIGERRFIEEHRRMAGDLLWDEPVRLVSNIAHRAANAYLFLHSVDDVVPVDRKTVPTTDISKLIESGWVSRDIWVNPAGVAPVWTSLDREVASFVRAANDIGLSEPQLAVEDWLSARAQVRFAQSNPYIWFRGFVLAAFPILCFGLAVAGHEASDGVLLKIAACIYCLQLLPYILITHYVRYQFPLLGLQALFVFYGIVGARNLLARRSAPAPIRMGA